jgi:FMN phosphatase YigB (HAD superfamily)
MVPSNLMKIRAIIFDVYRTIIHIGLAPGDAPSRWESLCTDYLGQETADRLSLGEVTTACDQVIGRDHDKARSVGINYPEVFWPEVMREVLPGLSRLAPEKQDTFMLEHILLLRNIQLMPGAVSLLKILHAKKLKLGIASNAQPYTLLELGSLLEPQNVKLDIFDPDLTFWSWENGFSKPSPLVFRILTARLKAQGIRPEEVLMVGDRVDNDVHPARAQGWQTWHLWDVPSSTEMPGGDWAALQAWLDA